MGTIMTGSRNSRIKVSIALLMFLLISVSLNAQTNRLEVAVGDVFGCPGQYGATVPIYLNNAEDTVFSYQLWMHLSRPDRIEFVTEQDSILVTKYYHCADWDGEDCIDSVECTNGWYCTDSPDYDICNDSVFTIGYWHCFDPGQFDCLDSIFLEGYDFAVVEWTESFAGSLDTTETMTSDWEILHTRSLGEQDHDLLVIGAANLYLPFDIYGIAPQTDNGMLIKAYTNVFDIPDTATERTVEIMMQKEVIAYAPLFYDYYSNAIGMIYDTIPDTHFYRCMQWADPPNNTICLSYERVSTPPYDSLYIYDQPILVYDTSQVTITNGSLIVLPCMIGDANSDNEYNLLDILAVIENVYAKNADDEEIWKEDYNCDCVVNLLDILDLIDRIYSEPIGQPEGCRYPEWQDGCILSE